MNTNQEPIDVEPSVPESTTTALAVAQAPPAPLAVVPDQTKAPVTAAQAKVEAIADLTKSAYARASELKLTDDEIRKLAADFPDEAFKPGAAGKESLIYIEHAFLRDRLNQVFGPGQWAIIPRSRWTEDFKTSKGVAHRVYVEAMLLIRGCFVGEAVGDMAYYPNNDSQNYGDAVEGAKTAAFRRCAKELGVGLQAWKKDWCEGWWARRNEKREQRATKPAAQTPVRHQERPVSPGGTDTAPQAYKYPICQSSAKSDTPAKKSNPFEQWLEDSRQTLLRELSGAPEQAQRYFEDQDWVMPGEPYTNASAGRLFPDCEPSKPSAENTDAMQRAYDEIISAVLGSHPQASEPEHRKSDFLPPWKAEEVPFGKDKGKLFGDLDGKALWYWIAVWCKKPLEDYVSPNNGKTYPPKESDVRLWNLLHEHRAEAMAHYKFSEPKD